MKDSGNKNILFYNLGDLSKPIHVQKTEDNDNDNPETQMVQQLNHLFVKSETEVEKNEVRKQHEVDNSDKIVFIAITEKNHVHFSYI